MWVLLPSVFISTASLSSPVSGRGSHGSSVGSGSGLSHVSVLPEQRLLLSDCVVNLHSSLYSALIRDDELNEKVTRGNLLHICNVNHTNRLRCCCKYSSM